MFGLEVEVLTLVIAFFGCVVAAFTDIRSGYIYHRLTVPLILVGLVLNVSSQAMAGAGIVDVLASPISAITAFLLGYILYLAGVWAGGDVMLLTALAALIPRPIDFLPILPFEYQSLLPSFPLSFIILTNSILGVFPYLLLFSLWMCTKKPEALKKIVETIVDPWLSLEYGLILGAAAVFTRTLLEAGLPAWAGWIMIIPMVIILRKTPVKPKFLFVTLLIILGFSFSRLGPIGVFKLVGLSVLTIFFLRLLLSVLHILRRFVFEEEVPITKLREGMIPAEVIYENGTGVHRSEKFSLNKMFEVVRVSGFRGVIKFLRGGDRRVVVDTHARGVTEEEITILQDYVRKGLLEDRIRVKRGMPFGPGFLVGLALYILVGDVFSLIGGFTAHLLT